MPQGAVLYIGTMRNAQHTSGARDMEIKIKTTRHGPGSYSVTDGKRTVRIMRHEEFEAKYGQWIASAEWDRYMYTDTLYTKRDAVFNARLMLQDARNED